MARWISAGQAPTIGNPHSAAAETCEYTAGASAVAACADPTEVTRIRAQGIPLGSECVHPAAEANDGVTFVFLAELVMEADPRRVARQDEPTSAGQRGEDLHAA
ncbi:hypothetical protein C3B59_15730 [Cryobacterium zongtaii]|uniref:Uncharacterized protein n=1 Tax=Cryobacterium zongtaii TaxID=1259217 RepID=A0A2S3Z6E5_9MICO|nr:hypothetical protein C3B59_15730 [Cryobacterium zongtaii]